MATSEQKELALNEAINIAKEVGKGGAEIASIWNNLLIDKTDRKLVEILDEIEETKR